MHVPGDITFCLRLGEAEIGFSPRCLTLQLAHTRGTCQPRAVSLGLVEVIPLACVLSLSLKLVQAGGRGRGAR
jgi:hypothetical protein